MGKPLPRWTTEAVRAVAEMFGWHLKVDPCLIAIRDNRCFYVERADLLVLPGVDGGLTELVTVQREQRCRALLICEGRTMTRAPTLYAQLRLCIRGRIARDMLASGTLTEEDVKAYPWELERRPSPDGPARIWAASMSDYATGEGLTTTLYAGFATDESEFRRELS